MAGIVATFNIPKTAMVANTAKTVLQILAPTNQRLRVLEYGIYFDSTSTTPGSAQLRILRQSTAGTTTTATPVPWENELTETLQASGGTNASAEPTPGSVLETPAIPITSGSVVPLGIPGQEMFIGGGTRLGFEVTIPAGAAANCYGYVKYEE